MDGRRIGNKIFSIHSHINIIVKTLHSLFHFRRGEYILVNNIIISKMGSLFVGMLP